MVYKEFQNTKLSALGMGAMRLPVIDGDDSRIDKEAAKQMVAYAMEHGVNYYDTAWGYHDGQSETVIGRILGKYPRDSYFLATKFPGYDLANMDKVEAIFEEQLKKCQVDYFDFYLFHNVCEMNIDAYLDPKFHIYDSLMARKKAGQIRHLGFSAHGKHAFNCVPVMAGIFLGGLLNHVDPNTTSLQMAGLFGTTLAPFAGIFGWPFGLLAGLIHSSVVLQAGLPLEGMNLYNNGFSGGLVAIVLYPVLISLVRHRRPVLVEEDLFALFESDTPQSVDQLPNRKD